MVKDAGRRRIWVIGLDGATMDLIRPWAAAGYLPTLARLMREGACGELTSTVPPVTAPAWISFMTGKGPAKHGVFHFRTYNLAKYTCYDERLVTSRSYAGSTIFDLASRDGLRVAAINVPMTYPPFPINGVMLSGYPTPNSQRAYTYPKDLAGDFDRSSITSEFFRLSQSERLRAAEAMLATLTRSATDLLRREVFDLFMIVYGNTDMANHFFRKYMEPGHPTYDARGARRYGTALRDQYQQCDRALGQLLELADPQTMVFVMSDHGSAPVATRHVNLSFWLRSLGLLQARGGGAVAAGESLRRLVEFVRIRLAPLREFGKRHLPPAIKEKISLGRQAAASIDWALTQAYRVPMAFHLDGININLAGRQPQGVVPRAEYESLRSRLLAAAAELRDTATGTPLVTAARRKEEIYSGPHLDNAPDIILHYNRDFAGAGSLIGPLVTPIPRYHIEQWSGQHAMNGMLVVWGSGVPAGRPIEGARIVDLAPTILGLLGVPIPTDIDGRFLEEAFAPELLSTLSLSWTRETGRPVGDVAVDEEDERQMREALRGLGYLS